MTIVTKSQFEMLVTEQGDVANHLTIPPIGRQSNKKCFKADILQILVVKRDASEH